MKPEVLVLAPIHGPTLAALERDYGVHKEWEAPEAGPNVRAIVTTGLVGFTRAHVEAYPKLEIVACYGSPRGTFDMAAAHERGIVVTNTPDVIAPAVADLAFGLLLSVMRRIAEGDRFVRAGKWPGNTLSAGTDLSGKTCGIVGLGQIGLGVARRAEAFGMHVAYQGPRQKGVAYRYCADVVELAKVSDCLVVTCPLIEETRGLVDSRVLHALGPEGFLVNVARGPVIEEQALLQALAAKQIAGAALDVYWDEPNVPQALVEDPNVVLTPHVGSNTREVRDERGAKLLANLAAHFAGKPVPHVFTEAMAADRR